MIKKVSLKHRYSNEPDIKGFVVNFGESEFQGAWYKSELKANLFHWFCELKRNNIENFQLNFLPENKND